MIAGRYSQAVEIRMDLRMICVFQEDDGAIELITDHIPVIQLSSRFIRHQPLAQHILSKINER